MITSVLYDLPIGEGKPLEITNPVANTVIGGWQFGGIVTLQSHMPGNLSIGGVDNASTAAGGYDRPNATGISPYLDNPRPSRYWNLDAFVEAPPGQFGNVGRNAIRVPESLDSTPKCTSNSKCRTRRATCSSSGSRRS
jgi:hypothetical protein